jgi:hypothetical protein
LIVVDAASIARAVFRKASLPVAAEAAQRGLTDEILDAELAAYNADQRGPGAPTDPRSSLTLQRLSARHSE